MFVPTIFLCSASLARSSQKSDAGKGGVDDEEGDGLKEDKVRMDLKLRWCIISRLVFQPNPLACSSQFHLNVPKGYNMYSGEAQYGDKEDEGDADEEGEDEGRGDDEAVKATAMVGRGGGEAVKATAMDAAAPSPTTGLNQCCTDGMIECCPIISHD